MASADNIIRLPIRHKSPVTQRSFDNKSAEKLDKRYSRLARKLKRARGGSPSVDIQTLQELLVMTMELIPIAKENYKQYRSDRGIYALNGLVNQIRELMTDLRQLRTGKKQYTEIINRIVMPNLSVLMQHYMADCTRMKQQISKLPRASRSRLNTQLTNSMQQQGMLFNEVSSKIQHALAEYLVS